MVEKARILIRSDGRARVELYSRSDSLFSYCEETLRQEEDYLTEETFEYWIPTHESGIYETLSEAEADARATIPWLRARMDD